VLEFQPVKLILQTQLLPDGDQARKLSATMRAFNAAADWLAGEAFRLKTANKVELQQRGYFDHADIVGAKNIRSGALVIAREVSAAAESLVSRETSSIYNRGASA
jgi:hypothetical protein